MTTRGRASAWRAAGNARRCFPIFPPAHEPPDRRLSHRNLACPSIVRPLDVAALNLSPFRARPPSFRLAPPRALWPDLEFVAGLEGFALRSPPRPSVSPLPRSRFSASWHSMFWHPRARRDFRFSKSALSCAISVHLRAVVYLQEGPASRELGRMAVVAIDR